MSLIWARVLMMASVLPFLLGKPVPKYVTVSASLALTFFVFPFVIPEATTKLSEDRLLLVALYLKEMFYGLTIGTAVSVIFHAFASVGQMIDNQRGVSIARLLIPQLGEQGSITGAFLFQFGIVIYLAVGGHLAFFDTFFMSFQKLPVLAFPAAGTGLFELMDLFMKITGEVIYIALQMSMPIIVAIFLADLILGVANRVAPQINVWELGFNIKGYLGTLLVFVSITMVAEQMQYYSFRANSFAKDTVELLEKKEPIKSIEAPFESEGIPSPENGPPPVKTK